MKAFFIGVAALALLGCRDERVRVHENDKLDAEIDEIRAANPGVKEVCLKKMRTGEFGAFEWMDNPDCFDMLPRQRWSGLWNTGWEWTNFCPKPAKECGTASEHGDIWLELAGERSGARSPPPDGLYQIEFVGRRTKAPGHFGHLDQYDHMMIVDRMISIRPVQVPWPAKAEEGK